MFLFLSSRYLGMELMGHVAILFNLWIKKKLAFNFFRIPPIHSWNNRLVQSWERNIPRLYMSLHLFNVYTEHIIWKLDWMTQSWNQDCWEKYQQLRICTWYHFNARKWRGTKEPLESEREWKSWLKFQHSKNEDHSIWSYNFMVTSQGKSGNGVRFHFLGLQNQYWWWLQPWN